MSDKIVVRALDPVDFHGQALMVVSRDGEPYVAMKPIVEGMGLDWRSQHRKLTDEQGRFCMVMMTMQLPGDDQDREVTTIPLRKLTGWLMTLQPSRMEGAIAERVLLYQNECDDALWAYWKNGIAVNPRAIPADPTLMGLPNFRDPKTAARAWAEQLERAEIAEEAALVAKAAVKQLAAKVEADAPRVEFAAKVEAAPQTHLIGQVAKVIQQGTGIQMGQNRLFEWLREHRYLHASGCQKNEPTQRCIDAGLMVLQIRTSMINDERTRVFNTPRVTGKGLLHLYARFSKVAVAEGRTPLADPPLVDPESEEREPVRQIALPLWDGDVEDEGTKFYQMPPEA